MRTSLVSTAVCLTLIGLLVVFWPISKRSANRVTDAGRSDLGGKLVILRTTTPETDAVHRRADKPRILNLDSAASAVVSQKVNDWLEARGCESWGSSTSHDVANTILRTMFLNGDLQAAQILAWRELYDPAHDRRQDAESLYREAALQGSTCALQAYYLYGKRLSGAHRTVETLPDGKKVVRYTRDIPANDATKRRDIIDAYAWDLVNEMRTGVVGGVMYSKMLEIRYHYNFNFATADYARACALADRRYEDLLAAREADGYGPFDNSPPPVMPDSATNPAQVGEHCRNWPGGRANCQRAEFHYTDQQGNAHAVTGWACRADTVTAP